VTVEEQIAFASKMEQKLISTKNDITRHVFTMRQQADDNR